MTTAFKRCLLNLVQLITFLEFFLFGDIVALFWSVGVGGFDWLVAEAEALLLPPLGDIGGKLVADGLLVFRKLVLLLYWGIWKLLKLKLTFWVMIMICNSLWISLLAEAIITIFGCSYRFHIKNVHVVELKNRELSIQPNLKQANFRDKKIIFEWN